MKVSNLIVNTLDKPFICLIGSNAAVGKTSLQIILASEAINEGKNVLFLSDDSPKIITEKFSKLLKNDNNLAHLHIAPLYENVQLELTVRLKTIKIDFLVIDDLHFFDKVKKTETFDYLRSLNIGVFISVQLARNTYPTITAVPLRLMTSSDLVLILEHYNSFTFFQNLKYFFMFWKNKPNRFIKSIKNRFDKNFEELIHINFERLTINK